MTRKRKNYTQEFRDSAVIPGLVVVGMAAIGLHFGLYCGFPVVWVPCAMYFTWLAFSVIGSFIDDGAL